MSKVACPPDQSLAHFGQDWLATFLATCPMDRINYWLLLQASGLHGNICCPNNTGRVIFMSNLSCCLVKIFVHLTHWSRLRMCVKFPCHRHVPTSVRPFVGNVQISFNVNDHGGSVHTSIVTLIPVGSDMMSSKFQFACNLMQIW